MASPQGTPIDLAAFIEIKQPDTRIRCDLKEKEDASLEDLLKPFVKMAMENRKQVFPYIVIN